MALRRAATVVLTVLVAWAMSAPSVDAGRKRKSKKRKGRLNMPKGWDWPPTGKMKTAGKKCRSDLTDLGVRWKKARRTRKIATPVRLPTMEVRGVALTSIWRKGPFVLDCHLVRALAHIAPDLRAVGVTALRFTTIHQYRFVRKNGRETKILSRHALGLAIDIFEVETDDGTIHVVKDRYIWGNKALHAVEDIARAAGVFRAVLTPSNDPRSHHDHFHFEAAMPIP